MEQILGIDPFEIVKCSGKAGIGIDELLEAIVTRIPPLRELTTNHCKRWSSIRITMIIAARSPMFV